MPLARRRARRRTLLAAACGVVFLALAFAGMGLHDYLAVTDANGAGVLVVEAWSPPEALAAVPQWIARGRYQHVVVVGYPRSEKETGSTSDAAIAELVRLGCDRSSLVNVKASFEQTRLPYVLVAQFPFGSAATARGIWTRKTYASVEAVAHWLPAAGDAVRTVDVFTVGVHARRSWMLYRRLLEPRYRVGIIAGPVMYYDRRRWFVSKDGLRLVSRNLAGCVYVKVCAFLTDVFGLPIL